MAKITHLTIIADDGDEVTIVDIQKMENFEVVETFTKPRSYLDRNFVHRIESISIQGKPLPLKDGTTHTIIKKVKE